MSHDEETGSALDAIILDVGGVLVDHENHLIYEHLAARCTRPNALEKIVDAIRDPRWDKGHAPIMDLHATLQRELGYQGDWSTFLEDWTCHFSLNEPMVALAHLLAAHHRVILFSNTNAAHWDFILARYPGALDPFERYLSHEMGMSKPDVAAFAYVAEHAKIAPSRSLFFDDRPDNVEGARRAGFRSAVFESKVGFERDLAAHAGNPGQTIG